MADEKKDGEMVRVTGSELLNKLRTFSPEGLYETTQDVIDRALKVLEPMPESESKALLMSLAVVCMEHHRRLERVVDIRKAMMGLVDEVMAAAIPPDKKN